MNKIQRKQESDHVREDCIGGGWVGRTFMGDGGRHYLTVNKI